MQLSSHFSLAELTVTNTGIDNSANAAQIEKLKQLAANLEKVRAVLGQPMHVNSAFRSHAVNVAVGGVDTSAHSLGYACDFVCAAFGDPFKICTALDAAAKAGKLKFDQLINEHDWVHISFDPRMRGQCLTLRPGRTYEPGIKR